MREIISTADAPQSPLFSQGVKVGSQIYVSGLVGIDSTTGELAGPTIHEQTRQALANCRAVLTAAGASLDDVVEVGVLLADPDDFAGLNQEWASWFPNKSADTLRREARRRDPRRPRLDPDDRRSQPVTTVCPEHLPWR